MYWRLEEDIGYYLLLCPFLLRQGFSLSFSARLETIKPQLSSSLIPLELGLQMCTGCLTWYMGAEIQTAVLMITEQAFKC